MALHIYDAGDFVAAVKHSLARPQPNRPDNASARVRCPAITRLWSHFRPPRAAPHAAPRAS
jgi:hypothetical protein